MITIEQNSVREIINKKFTEKKQRNSSYSIRAFSKKLDLNSGALSQIMRGKRRISKDFAEKIIEKLDLSVEEKADFLDPFLTQENIEQKSNIPYTEINTSPFLPEEMWVLFAILNLCKVKNFPLTPENISLAIGVSEEISKAVLDKVSSQELLTKDQNGHCRRSSSKIQTTDNIQSNHMQRCHEINCDLAKSKLSSTDYKNRDFTSMTFAINPKRINEAKSIIRKFQDELSVFLESDDPTDVYKLNVQLFPLFESSNKLRPYE